MKQFLHNRKAILEKIPKGVVMAQIGVDIDLTQDILDVCSPRELFVVDDFREEESFINRGYRAELLKAVKKAFKDSVTVINETPSDFFGSIDFDVLEAVVINSAMNPDYDTTIANLYDSFNAIAKGVIVGNGYNLQSVRAAINLFCGNTCLDVELITRERGKDYSFYLIKV